VSQLQIEDLRSMQYFHKEKGDITRFCDWEKLKPLVRLEYPEVIAAMAALKVAERTLDAAIYNMVEQGENKE